MYGVAAALLPLSTTFGRKLCTGVIQFVYTLIQVISDRIMTVTVLMMTRSILVNPQDHAVWQNQQFWESTFFNDVQKGIKELYIALQDQAGNNQHQSSPRGHVGVTNQLSVEKHVGSRAREVGQYKYIRSTRSCIVLYGCFVVLY